MHVATATTAIDQTRPDVQRKPRSGRWFFVGMAVAAAVTVFLGFVRTYYLKSFFPMPSLPWLFHIHGALFTAWMLLLVLQAALIAARRIALHRRVGLIGGFLVVPMLVTGCVVAIAAARGQGPISAAVARGELTRFGPGLPPLQGIIVPLTTMLLFGAFAGAGLAWRRWPDVHKRFMALATIAILPPAIGRAMGWVFGSAQPALFFGAVGFFVLAIVVYDRQRLGRVHPVTLWGGLALMLSFPGRLALGKTDLWLTFAAWLVR